MRFKIPGKEDVDLSQLLSVQVAGVELLQGRRVVKFTKSLDADYVKSNKYFEVADNLLSDKTEIQFTYRLNGEIKTVSVDKRKHLQDLFYDYAEKYKDLYLFDCAESLLSLPCYIVDTGIGINTAEEHLRSAGFNSITFIPSSDIENIQDRITYNHGQAWKKAVEEEHKRFLIVDSDCVFTSNFFNSLLNIKGIVPELVDVLFLGGRHPISIETEANYSNFVKLDACFAYIGTREILYEWIGKVANSEKQLQLASVVSTSGVKQFALTHSPFLSENFRDFRLQSCGDLGLAYKSKSSTKHYPLAFHDEDIRELDSSFWVQVYPETEYEFNTGEYLLWESPDKDNVDNIIKKFTFPSAGVLTVNDAVVCGRGLVFNRDTSTRYGGVTQLGTVRLRTQKNSETKLTWFGKCNLDNNPDIPLEYKGGTALNMTKLFGNNNLCHALLDSMGCGIHVLNKAKIDLQSFDWYIVPSFKNNIISSLYKKLNLAKNKLIHCGLKYDPVTKQTKATHKNGFIFDSVTSPTFSGFGRLYRKDTFLDLRELFKEEMSSVREPYRLIYLSREGGGRDASANPIKPIQGNLVKNF